MPKLKITKSICGDCLKGNDGRKHPLHFGLIIDDLGWITLDKNGKRDGGEFTDDNIMKTPTKEDFIDYIVRNDDYVDELDCVLECYGHNDQGYGTIYFSDETSTDNEWEAVSVLLFGEKDMEAGRRKNKIKEVLNA